MTVVIEEKIEQKQQPGETVGHICRVHDLNSKCDADPHACESFCGYVFHDQDGIVWDNDGGFPVCVVCYSMWKLT